jgi:hypothetical protein
LLCELDVRISRVRLSDRLLAGGHHLFGAKWTGRCRHVVEDSS